MEQRVDQPLKGDWPHCRALAGFIYKISSGPHPRLANQKARNTGTPAKRPDGRRGHSGAGNEVVATQSVVEGGGAGGEASQPSHGHRSTSNIVDDSTGACPPSRPLRTGAPENIQKDTLVKFTKMPHALLATKALNCHLALPLLGHQKGSCVPL